MHTTRDTDLAARRFNFSNLIEAIQQKNTARARQLLAKDPELVNMRIHDPQVAGYHHFTPLHVAAMGGSLEIIGQLIDAGALLHASNAIGDPPFNLAMFNNHGTAMLYFKSRGFDPFSDQVGMIGSIPIGRAAQGHYDDAALLLIKMGIPEEKIGMSLCHLAIHGRTIPFLKLATEIEAAGKTLPADLKNRILYNAAQSDALEIAEFVLARGTDPDAPMSIGVPEVLNNSTKESVRRGSVRVLRRMVEMGADMTQKCGPAKISMKQVAQEHCPHTVRNEVFGLIQNAPAIRKAWLDAETERFSSVIRTGGSKNLPLPTRRKMP